MNHYLNLTMAQVYEHCGAIYESDMNLLTFNKTLVLTIQAVNYTRYMVSVLTDISTKGAN